MVVFLVQTTTIFFSLAVTSRVLLCLFSCCVVQYSDSTTHSARIVISLTTSPNRLKAINTTLNTLLHQTIAVDVIYINLPRVVLRKNITFPADLHEKYPILTHSKIRTSWHNDFGPITKLLPTLIMERHPETLIILVDDDMMYPSHLVEMMVEGLKYDPNYVQTAHCSNRWLFNTDEEFLLPPFNKRNHSGKGRGRCCCRFHEGFGGVGFRRAIFDNPNMPFQRYLDVALRNEACFLSDDYLISNYLAMNGYLGLALNDKVTVVEQPLAIDDADTLHRLSKGGHPYQACTSFLRSHNLSLLRARTWKQIQWKKTRDV